MLASTPVAARLAKKVPGRWRNYAGGGPARHHPASPPATEKHLAHYFLEQNRDEVLRALAAIPGRAADPAGRDRQPRLARGRRPTRARQGLPRPVPPAGIKNTLAQRAGSLTLELPWPCPTRCRSHPSRSPCAAAVTLPGSKSITNRALLLAALSAKSPSLRCTQRLLQPGHLPIMIAALQARWALTGRSQGQQAHDHRYHRPRRRNPRARSEARHRQRRHRRALPHGFGLPAPGRGLSFRRRRGHAPPADRRALLEAFQVRRARKAGARSFPFTLKTAKGCRGSGRGDSMPPKVQPDFRPPRCCIVAPLRAEATARREIQGRRPVSKPFIAMTEADARPVLRFGPPTYTIRADASATSYFPSPCRLVTRRPDFAAPLLGHQQPQGRCQARGRDCEISA